MGTEIVGAANGVLTVRISGLLTEPAFAAAQRAAAEAIDKEKGSVSVLVLARDFLGWQRGGAWGDMSFQHRYDERIKKMAVVCEEQWRELSLMFTGQGIREFPVRHFSPSEEDQAREWLAEG